MISINKISLKINSQKNLIIKFLEENGLDYEELDLCYACFEDEKIIATGGRKANVLKCFAVDEKRREDGLFDQIISSLIADAYLANYKDLFVFTKKDYIRVFESFSFSLLAKTDKSALLFRSDKKVYDFLENPPFGTGEEIGAIVMNANPFSLGHRYLAEKALTYVNKLLVFVLENDESFFSFKDRFEMVKLGLNDLERVKVLKSSSFIISSSTFPSYFLKDKKLISEEHAKIDAYVFKKYFLDYYGIKIRFLGSEPIDQSTAIYNRVLKEILEPDCEVKIIERKEIDGSPVSASNIRKAFMEKNLDQIKRLAPISTYNFLEKILWIY